MTIRLLGASAGALAGGAAMRSVAHRSGVTDAEVATPLPGDDLVPDATDVIDRATSLPGVPADVWPWIVQLGKGRGGWYFPRWLERVTPASRRGLRRLEPRLTQPQIGDDHADWGPGTPVLRVVEIDPPRALVHLSLRDKADGHRWPDGRADRPGVLAMSWALVLTEAGPGQTRLHLRLRLRLRVKSSQLATLGGVFDWATVELLFAGLRERVGG